MRDRGLYVAAVLEQPLRGRVRQRRASPEPERALELLEKMALTDQAGTSKDWIKNDPDLDSLRELPRFKAVLNRMP